MDDIDIVNAELSLQEYFEEEDIDFRADREDSDIGLASDLMFILDNTKIHEPEDTNLLLPDISLAPVSSSSSSETEDSDTTSSEVQVIEITKNQVQPILISSSDDCEKSMPVIPKTKNKDKLIVRKLLSSLTLKVDRILNGEDLSEDEDSHEVDFQHERENLAAIIQDESKISNYVPKVHNEVLLEELPVIEEIEDIKLTKEDTLMVVGSILSVVDKLIVVEADLNAPALDAESAFFLNSEHYLGKVFDTFGPVKHPYYTIRLLAKTDVSKLSKGTKVFFVPFNKELTKYVFVEQLKNLKGSDASWKGDQEPPVEFLDYSDEEEERKAKQKLKSERKEKFQADSNKIPENKNGRGASNAARNRLAHRFNGTNPLMDHAIEHHPFKTQHTPRNNNPNKNKDLSTSDNSSSNFSKSVSNQYPQNQNHFNSNNKSANFFHRDSLQNKNLSSDFPKRFPLQNGHCNPQNANFKNFVDLSMPMSSHIRPNVPIRPLPTTSNQRFEPNNMPSANYVPRNTSRFSEPYKHRHKQSDIPLDAHNDFNRNLNMPSYRMSNPNGAIVNSIPHNNFFDQEIKSNLATYPNCQNGFSNQQISGNNQPYVSPPDFHGPQSGSSYNMNGPPKRFDSQQTTYDYNMNNQSVPSLNRFENQQPGNAYQAVGNPHNNFSNQPNNSFYNQPNNALLQNHGQFIPPHQGNTGQSYFGYQPQAGYQPSEYQPVIEPSASPIQHNNFNNKSFHQSQEARFNFSPNHSNTQDYPIARFPTPNHLVNSTHNPNFSLPDFSQSGSYSKNQNTRNHPCENYINSPNHQSSHAWSPTHPQPSYNRPNFRSFNRH